jgi:type I restriction enzyme S subunit
MNKMKNSNIQWIGEIPDDWEVMPNKYVMCKKKDICSHYNGENILSLSMNGVIVRDLDAGGKIPATFNGYQYIHPNNLLMCLFDYDVTPRCIGLIKDEGVTSPAYSQFVLKNGNNPSYYYYYYLMLDNTKELLHLAKNLRHSFTEEQLGVIPVCVPPLATQTSIATYLDAKCSEIDGLIADINKQIETLNELKKSTITEAVTKGLNKNAKLKDSGIQWIGMIPEGWSVSRVGLYYDIILGKMLCNEPLSSEYSLCDYYCAMNIHFGSISKPEKKMWFSNYEKKQYRVRENDLLVVEGGAGAGGCAIVKNLEDEVYVQNSVMIVRPKKDNNIIFLGYLIESLVKRNYVDIVCNKATIPHFTKEKLSKVPLTLPPLAEQHDIAAYLDTKCSEFDSIISDKQKQISTLEAYKKSLIYEYVTGKKKVE